MTGAGANGQPCGGLAVMADRHLAADHGRDFFPTWPWATRSLCTHVLPALLPRPDLPGAPSTPGRWMQTVWEPAAGQGHMVLPLGEFFDVVIPSDIHDYGAGYPQHDFLSMLPMVARAEWIITNPPFRLFLEFAERALSLAAIGVALLGRLAVLEGRLRYERLFRASPPAIVAPFVERVPMASGRLGDSTATAYAWLVWLRAGAGPTTLHWIPPCRAKLTRRGDDGIGAAS